MRFHGHVVVVASAVVCACSAGAPVDGIVGRVEASLSAVGPDGATYSLPAGASLAITTSAGTTETVPLSTTTATQSISLPTGSYTATLQPPPSDAATTWTLTRTTSSGTSTVGARLVDSAPYTLSVTAGTTTSLVFHFDLLGLGDVTFATGSVDPSLRVDPGAFPMSTASVTGSAPSSTETLHGTSAFNAALKFSGTVAVPYTLSLRRTGDWTRTEGAACAPIAVTASTSSKRTFAAIVSEASGGAGEMCFGDAGLGGLVTIAFARNGAPTTSTFTSVLPSGGTFGVKIEGYAPAVFDGATLSLSKLPVPFTLASASTALTVESSSGALLATVLSAPTGSASITLVP